MNYRIQSGTKCLVDWNGFWHEHTTKEELNFESKDYVEWQWSDVAGVKDLIFMFWKDHRVWSIKVSQLLVEIIE